MEYYRDAHGSDLRVLLDVTLMAAEEADFAEHVNELLWSSYDLSGQPFGKSEQGMALWWAFEQFTTNN